MDVILEGAEMANVLSMPRPIYTLKLVKVSLATEMLARRAKWQHLVLCIAAAWLAGLTLMSPAVAEQSAAESAVASIPTDASEDPAVVALIADADAAYASAADLRV